MDAKIETPQTRGFALKDEVLGIGP